MNVYNEKIVEKGEISFTHTWTRERASGKLVKIVAIATERKASFTLENEM